MNTSKFMNTTRRIFLVAAVAATATQSAHAAWAWTGKGENSDWSTGANWNTSASGSSGAYFRYSLEPYENKTVNFSRNESWNYNVYVDDGTTEVAPLVWTASADDKGLALTAQLHVGYLADGYLSIQNGTYAFNGDVYVGANANMKGELTINGGTVVVSGNLNMNSKSGSTATFYNRGGDMVVTNDLIVQNRGSGEFYMEGGHVTVSNIVRFGEYVLNSGDVGNLYLNGGVFEAKMFRFHNASDWYTYGYVVLNGGTYKAMADGSMALNTGVAATDGRKGAVSMLHFKVGERGGTIDTAGHDVVFPLKLLQDGSSKGGLSVKGGGSLTLENANVTYEGKTCVEAGTLLVVSNSTAKSNILSHGLELAGALTLGTPYTVFRCNDDLTEDDLANVTCGAASEFTKAVGGDGKSIVVTVSAFRSGWWTGAAGDNNLSNGANWSDGIVPTSGNVTFDLAATVPFIVGDTFRADTITMSSSSAGVTIGAGDLHLNALTNSSKLAIASGASLTVEGDVVLTESGAVLYSNEGTVLVKGDVDFQTTGSGNRTYYQYEVVTGATTPIMADGLAYNGPSNYLTVYLGKNADSSRAGQWVVGAKGLHYKNGRNIWHTGFMMGQGVTTLHSSSDWTLASSGRSNSTRDLGNYYDISTDIKNCSLVLDTNNYTNNAVAHTITLNGRLISSATEDPAVTIKGAGTVVVNTSEGVGREGYQRTSIGMTLAVTDTATLKINTGKSIIGDGKISLAAGTTLALESTAGTFTEADVIPVALPESGRATINIDGTKLRACQDFTVCKLSTLPEGYNVANHVAVTGTALDGRRYSVKAVEVTEDETTVTKLVLNVASSGLIVIFR